MVSSTFAIIYNQKFASDQFLQTTYTPKSNIDCLVICLQLAQCQSAVYFTNVSMCKVYIYGPVDQLVYEQNALVFKKKTDPNL